MASVLVVDDDPSIRLLCRINLELDGHEVVEAGTLSEARATLEAHEIDVVLLDLHVGPEHGIGLLGELRARRPPIPVAVVSGSAELDADEAALASASLRKPFEIDELRETVRQLVSA